MGKHVTTLNSHFDKLRKGNQEVARWHKQVW